MKLTTESEALRKALTRLSNVPGANNAHIPTLLLIVEATVGGCRLRRTTANASISVALEAKVEEEGICGVGYETLVNAAAAMAAKETTIEANNKELRMQSAKTKAQLNAYPAEELLPEPQPTKNNGTIALASGDLGRWMGLAQPAMSTTPAETKFYGLCIRAMQGMLAMVGVDRRRMHIAYIGADRPPLNKNQNGKDDGIVLPVEAVTALRKLLPEEDAACELTLQNGSLRATVADVDAYLPLATEQPPDMEGVLPPFEEAATSAFCNRAELQRAARTAAPMGFQESRAISIKFKEGALEIIADNRTGALLSHEIDATVTGAPKHIRSNGQYFAEFVEAIADENIQINYWEERGMIYAYSNDRLLALTLIRDELSGT